ncbi:hypothetical protein DICVIV_05878 [Dictyocaulus viviparus]|uniref:Uncharacterized protein n=1 Tax=Dictyocaulus viviparus TaxID=29172 RepID=A0A0D8XTS8_DICVI|nr:hypothetical protein DICVIV_05878 [Dictyocaulus viviparus]
MQYLTSFTPPNYFIPHLTSDQIDVVEAFRRSVNSATNLLRSSNLSTSSSDCSESEGICADYHSNDNTSISSLGCVEGFSMNENNDFQFNDPLIMVRSADLSSHLPVKRSDFKSRCGTDVSVLCKSTSKTTRIPSLMSRSLSASCERNAIQRLDAFSSPVSLGSSDHLCDDRIDIKCETRQLLARSQKRLASRMDIKEPRSSLCVKRQVFLSSSLPPILRRSVSRPRFFTRPQMPRRGEQSLHVGRSCSVEHYQETSIRESLENNSPYMPPMNSSQKKYKKRRNNLGGYSLDIEKLVVLRKSTLSRCHVCRHANSLRRLVSRYSLRIGKYNVAHRSLCICGRDKNLSLTVLTIKAFIDPMSVKRIVNMFDYAALLAFIALILNIVLRLLNL